MGIEQYLNHPTPSIKQFAKKVYDRTVDSGALSAFEKWRSGPKCKPEDHAVADELLAAARALGDGRRAGAIRAAEEQKRKAAEASHRGGGSAPSRGDNLGAAAASVLGLPFHNPYTFVPFGPGSKRRTPTPLTIDESDPSRLTGILELELALLSPLLSCSPVPESATAGRTADDKSPKRYPALRIGDDVVVPASGVKGALRTLLTVLTGGTLGYIDETSWLCQGRDCTLGPSGPESAAGTPQRPFLGRVVEPGSATREGTIELGTTTLIKLTDLGDVDKLRPRGNDRQKQLTHDGFDVKLSGRRVNTKGQQHEGGFKAFEPEKILVLDRSLWAAYEGRHRHGAVPRLKKGDLVWLEPSKPDLNRIQDAADVKSLQWARWGRRGKQLLELIREKHKHVLPDAMNKDGKVDEVTDLFGQTPNERNLFGEGPGPAPAFAARVRPENLVFRDAGRRCSWVQLPPLAAPHPGCLAFYRDQTDADHVSAEDPLRGYKVYRTTCERGENAPWHWQQQPVFGDQGEAKKFSESNMSKSVELLPDGTRGTLRLSLRGLSEREVALLLLACSVDWRLGGGKPLGLGHARVVKLRMLDENGDERLPWTTLGDPSSLDREKPAPLPGPYAPLVEDLAGRAALYQSTQRPVERLRYPRAVDENNNKKSRGGHVWFQRHAQPKKSSKDVAQKGVQVLWTGGKFKDKIGADRVAAQMLPKHDPEKPRADCLYGYDGFVASKDKVQSNDRRTLIHWFEAFDQALHARASDRSGGNHSQNRDSRRQSREDS